MAYLQSSQNFVRALKAPHDPPSDGSPTKIDIARAGWDDVSLNVQNKAEAITEFILTRLLKDKAKTTDNPITDMRYWDLLSSVLGTLSLSTSSSASTKAWLLPLLNRVPLVPICTSLLERSGDTDSDSALGVLNASSKAITVLWPLTSPKFTVDILLDCFGALLPVAARLPNNSAGLSKLGSLVTTSLQESFNNSSNKKKLQQTFSQTHLRQWITCIASMEGEGPVSPLLTDLYHIGQEILYNAETLKGLSETGSLKVLFAAMPVTEASLKALPKLLHSFGLASQKNRILFGQGNSAPAAARTVAMLFFSHCADYVLSAPNELSGTAYATRLFLLRVVEKESLYSFGQVDGQEAIRREVDLCTSALPLDSNSRADSALLLDCLCVISRIDQDIVEPQFPELLRRLLVIPSPPHPAAASASELLTLCISYHSRARSLPSLLERVQGTFTSLSSTAGSAREMYLRVAASPLLAQTFLASLAKAVQTFVTPGQVLSIAEDVVAALERAYNTYTTLATQSATDIGLGSRKKARKSRASMGSLPVSDICAVNLAGLSFVFLTRLAACILPALPIQTVTADVQEEVKKCIHRADFITDDIHRPELLNDDDRRTDSWATQIVFAAALRLVYTLQGAPRLQFPSLPLERKRRIVEMHQHTTVLPELFLETSRYLLKTIASKESEKCSPVVDRILIFLEQHLQMSQAWNGRSAELAYGDDGASQAATGLLRLMLDRFIHVFDTVATQAQLDRLVELLSTAAASASLPANAITPAMVAQDCLRSAQLWEQRRLRMSLLSSVTARLEGVDAIRFETIADAAPHSFSPMSIGMKTEMTDRALQGLYLLLYCPAEYLSKSSRADIVRRAVTFDMALMAVKLEEDRGPSASKVVRTFLRRTFCAFGSAEHQHAQAYLESLVRSVGADGADDRITLDIIDVHVRAVFRKAQRGTIPVPESAATLLLRDIMQSSPDVDEKIDILRERLMLVLTRDYTVDSFPIELRKVLCTFKERVSDRLKSLSGTLATADGALQRGSVVAMTSAYLRFSSWLGLEVNDTPLKATDLIQMSASSEPNSSERSSQDLIEAAFGLLVAEFECKTGAREDRLARLLASYTTLSQTSCLSGKNKVLDDLLLQATRRLSLEDFGVSLDLVAEMLRDGKHAERLSATVRLGSVLLRGAPEGTLKMTQAFFTSALCTFVDYPHFSSHHLLRTQTLDLLDQHCCERPASLRLVNLTTIWPLLAHILAGTPTCDSHASPTTFHQIVFIVSALVRLRRDLVANTLPHMCIVLRMLVTCLRGPRPNLGEKQRRTVADSLPAWVKLDHPLGSEEGRALARLMTTLATKTIVRVHARSSESQKADSLARPLSKHVAYVIQAYVGAVNDPLCVVPLAVRQELMPGLFALCGMLNEHDRDALMVSGLDAAGKATLKALWKDYEKQRYVGKG